jgi:gamma-glutamyl hercynylcysteine S-oxide synthase
VRRLTGAPSLHPELEDVYDAIETPRARRSEAPILGEAAARRYLDEVRARALDALARADLSDDAEPLTAGGFVFDLVAQHEAQHTETVLQ